ncbi:rod shape-determining protein MreD [Caloramator sp. mosi_1]|uniref:rod shape-determining protein MreD n=1 Tax=Caloramator sp. mosi_1 TaxID=3023090 RepID=UPI002360F73C|nr:rod shape-determining protein MreD [Caloramator sp. mosi_1]WDC83865.1 rod shape-determining protein MreD [Caloramator sp. mosi_1]
MKRGITFILLGLLCLILQNTIFMNFSILGVKVDLLLVYIVSISMFLDKMELIFVVIPIGILKDAFFPYVFGINTLTYLIVSYFVNLIEGKIYKDTIIIPVLFIGLATIIKFLIFICFMYPTGMLSFSFGNIIILFVKELVLNVLMILFVYNRIRRIVTSEKLKKDWKF